MAKLSGSDFEQIRRYFGGQRMAGTPAAHGLTVEEAERAGLGVAPVQAGVAPPPFVLAPRVGYGLAGALGLGTAKVLHEQVARDPESMRGGAPPAERELAPPTSSQLRRGVEWLLEEAPRYIRGQVEADTAAQAALLERGETPRPWRAAAKLAGVETAATPAYLTAMVSAPVRAAVEGTGPLTAFQQQLEELPGGEWAEQATADAGRQAQEHGVPWWARAGIQLLAPGPGELKGGLAAAAAFPAFRVAASRSATRGALRDLEQRFGHRMRPAHEIPVIPALAHGQGARKGQVAIVGDNEYTTHTTLAREAGHQSLSRSGLVRGYINKLDGEFITDNQAQQLFGRSESTQFFLGEPLGGVAAARGGLATPQANTAPAQASREVMGVRETRGGGRRMAARPEGRAARLRSDIVARKSQPLVEPEDLVGDKMALQNRVDIRSAKTTEEAVELANTGRHIKRDADGSYVGAKWIKSPEDLVAMRSNFDDLVDQGVKAGGEDWYIRTKDGIRAITSGEASERRVGRELGATSRQRTPETNLDMGVGAHNAANVGDRPPKLFDEATREGFAAEAAGSGQLSEGLKITPYTHNITPGMGGLLPANDIWMHRIIGGSGEAPTAPGHTFLDAETMLAVERANARALGGRTDWTASEIQAASWVAMKGRDFFEKKQGRWTMDQALAEAAKSYPDYFPKHTYRSTAESTPGAVSGHMPGVTSGTYAEQEAYASAADRWVQAGRDVLAEGAGLDLQPGTGGRMVGAYKGAVSPGEYSETLVGFATDPRRMGTSERAALEKVEAFRAVVDGQAAGAGHYTMPEGAPGLKAGELTGVEALTERAMTPEEMVKFESTVGAQRGGLEWVSNTGARAIGQFDAPVSKATETAIRGALEEAGIPLRTLRRAKHDSILQDFGDEWAEGEGAVTRKLLEIMSGEDAPLVAQRMEANPAVKQAVLSRLARDAKLAAEHIPGYEVNQALQNFRRIWVESGFDGLRRALESGELLPAVFLPAIGLGVALSLSEEEEPNL